MEQEQRNNSGILWIIIGFASVLAIVILGYYLTKPNEEYRTQQADIIKEKENEYKQKKIDSLEKENKKRESELLAIKRKDKEKKEQEDIKSVVKFSGFDGKWVSVCTDANGSEYYIEDADIEIKNNAYFSGRYLRVYNTSGNLTDNSVIAMSGTIEFNINKRTSAFINSNTIYYAGKPSKYGSGSNIETSISKGSVIDLLFEAFKKRIK